MEIEQKELPKHMMSRVVKICLLLTMMGIIVLLASVKAQDANADVLVNEGPNCRYGASSGNDEDHPFMQQMNMGWTLDFSPNPGRVVPPGIEYIPIIRLDGLNGSPANYYMRSPSTVAALISMVEAYPGKLWMVGNEVDRIFWQDQIYPDDYAMAYHNIYHLIKDHDPSAQVAISGLVEVTPGRLQYLDKVWDAYLAEYGTPMPVDVWNMHVYVMPEAVYKNGSLQGSRAGIALGTDPTLAKLESDGTPNQCHLDQVYCMAEHDDIEIFKQQIVSMRQWMKAHGQQNKPLLLSEFSLLYAYTDDGPTCFEMDEYGNCFDPPRVSQFMIKAFDYLETAVDANLGYSKDSNRLVQQWLWFSMNYLEDDPPNRLIDGNPLAFTQMGITFRNYTTAKTLYQNLFPDQDTVAIVASGSPTATLSFDIRNNGNTATTKLFTVTYYADEAQTQPIGSVEVPAGVGGCARITVTTPPLEWGGLQTGINRFWAKIDSDNDLGADEPNKNDNLVQGFVLFNPEQIFLPTIQR